MKHRRPVEVIGMILCRGTCALLVTGGNVNAAQATAAEIFHDDFEDNDPHDGSPVTWVPDRRYPGDYLGDGGDYVFTDPRLPPTGKMRSRVSEYVPGDTSIRTQVRTVFGGTVSVALVLLEARGQGANDATYWAGWSGGGGGRELVIGLTDANGVPITLASEPATLRLFDEDYILQFDAVGSALSLFAWPADESKPDVPQVTATDDTYSTGLPGLFAQVGIPVSKPILANEIRFRWVSVTPEPTTVGVLTVGGLVLMRRRWRYR